MYLSEPSEFVGGHVANQRFIRIDITTPMMNRETTIAKNAPKGDAFISSSFCSLLDDT
jgi:hypothetical protein